MIRLSSVIALVLLGLPGVLAAQESDELAIQRYARARVADAAGQLDVAAAGYGAALAASPGDEVLAIRAYRQAMGAGDRRLALQAAHVLDAKGVLPPDGRLLLLTEAVEARDWKAASARTDQLAKEDVFGFMVPVLRAWIAFGARDKGATALLNTPAGGSLGAAYAAEHRALLLLASGQEADGLSAVRAQAAGVGGRATRIRLAAAAMIAKRDRDAATALLVGDDPALAAGRALLEARRPIPAPVNSAAAGIAELFARVAIDVNRERVTPLALTLARLATFLAPENSETWLVTSELLAAADQYDAALSVLGRVASDDPFATSARGARLQLLVRKGEQKMALAEALATAHGANATQNDWQRVGDLQSDLGNHDGAAASYGKAVALNEAGGESPTLWMALMLQGGALEQGGRWTEAKPLLERAATLAPNEAAVLNYLGYAQLERRQNLAEAEKLIERASQLQPDDAAITDSLGWAYFIRGNLPKAIETLERAVVGQPADPTINEHLGDAYWTVGRRLDARHAWAAALVYAGGDEATRLKKKLDTGLTAALASP